MTFPEYLELWRPRIDEALDASLPPAAASPASLHRAMRYTVFAGGKRLRPVLCLLSARSAGGAEEAALPAACAVEMVHAFSLIHDDLPAMDDDDLRRGKPTSHKVFGEGTAILAGDALLNHAFATLAGMAPAETAARSVRILAEAVGTAGLIGGQVEDLEAEGRTPDLAVVESIHRKKTAALLGGCARLGVAAVGGGEEIERRLASFAETVGLAFQIRDDVLDETRTAGELGKSPGKDRARGKMTWPAAAGLEASRRRARALVEAAREEVKGLPGADLLYGLAERVVERTA